MGRQLTAEPPKTEAVSVAPEAVERTTRVGQIRLSDLTAPVLSDVRGPEVGARREAIFRFSLAAADTSAVMTTLIVVAVMSGGRIDLRWGSVGAIPILWLAAKLLGLYDRDEVLIRKTTLDEVPTIFQLATLSAVLCWLAHSVVYTGLFEAKDALFLWLFLSLMIACARTVARALALRLSCAERCLFIGDARSAAAFNNKLAQGGGVRATIVARADVSETAPWSASTLSMQRLGEIRDLAREIDLHRVIIAPANDDHAEMFDLIHTFEAIGVRVTMVPRVLEVAGSAIEFDDLHGLTVMGVRRFKIGGSAAALKRALDLAGAAILVIVFAPLLLVIAVAVFVDNPGAILFKQTRVGRHGSHFAMLKFRTMVTDAEQLKANLIHRNEAQEGFFKITNDPRVTRFGRILRRTSLDELPQLFNVLRGEMSLVGPRPLIPHEDERVKGWHRRRLELTPGMTGHWQLLGSTRVTLHDMAAMDYLYAAHWSLWTDLKIMLRTVPHVLGRRGR